jgi:hypothetical protein
MSEEYAVKRLTGAFALIALAAGSVAMAQETRSQTATPPSASPSTQYPSAQQSGKEDADTKAAKKEQIKSCMAQQQASNTGMSKHEMKKYCENQANGTPKNPPHD